MRVVLRDSAWRLRDDLGGLLQHGLRNGEAQTLSGLHVDAEFEPARLLDWQLSRPGALEDLVHVVRSATIVFELARSIVHEPAVTRPTALRIHGRQAVLGREV